MEAPDSVPMFQSLEEAAAWVRENMEYVGDRDGVVDDPSPAGLVISRGYGDCEDISGAFLEIVDEQFGVEGDMCVGYLPDLDQWHAWAEVGDFRFYYIEGARSVSRFPYRTAALLMQVAEWTDFDGE